jgi:adenylate cyclase
MWSWHTVHRILRIPWLVGSLLSLLAVLVVLGCRSRGYLEALDLAVYDQLIRLQPPSAPTDTRVVLLAISEDDLQQYWPLTDATLARMLERLLPYQPRAIGLDIYRDIAMPPGHEELAAVFTSQPQIITVMKFGPAGRIAPSPMIHNAAQIGFNDVLVDQGGTVRRGLLFLDDGNNVVYSFALRLALVYLQAEGIVPQPDPTNPQHLRLGQVTIPPLEANDGGYVDVDAGGYQFLLDWRNRPEHFHTLSLRTLLQGEIAPALLHDKIVIIGVVAESVKDMFLTPYHQGMQALPQWSGVALHAQMTSQLLRHGLDGMRPLATWPDRVEILWTLLWGALGGTVGLWRRSWGYLVLGSAATLFLLVAIAYGAFLQAWWIPVLQPILAWLGSAALVTASVSMQERRQRLLLMDLFAQHVSSEVADVIWQQREQFLEGGRLLSRRVTASVLFTDVVGFTTMAERLPPDTLMEWLNVYMTAMADQVIAHEGVINKYIGDSIMALFGVPLERTTAAEIRQDARRAVECALAMEQALKQLNIDLQKQQLPTIGMRIGICTGELIAGSLGSSRRLEYTVIGDTVNVAARLEGVDKETFLPDFTRQPCRIFIAETTLQYLGEQFETQRIGPVQLKGKEQSVVIYRVLRRRDTTHHNGEASQ